MKDPGSYANPINSSFQKFRTTTCNSSGGTSTRQTSYPAFSVKSEASVGVGMGVVVGTSVAVGCGVDVAVGKAVGVGGGVAVGVSSGVTVAAAVGSSVGVGSEVGVGIGVDIGAGVKVDNSVLVGSAVGARVTADTTGAGGVATISPVQAIANPKTTLAIPSKMDR